MSVVPSYTTSRFLRRCWLADPLAHSGLFCFAMTETRNDSFEPVEKGDVMKMPESATYDSVVETVLSPEFGQHCLKLESVALQWLLILVANVDWMRS